MMPSPDENNLAVQVKTLTKKFGPPVGGLTAVDDISFNVKRGEIFAFLGPNGAGKTTTIKMLTTLLIPTKGEILLNGINPVKQQDEARKTFGIVFQDPSLDEELTAYENMQFHAILYHLPSAKRKKDIEYLLKFVALWERKNNLVKTFSGGMKRRLEIARGLLHHPKILFLDEPTLGLDPQTRNLIWTHIKELNKNENITIFLTTHYMEEAERIAQKIAIIDHGKIIAQGNAQELKNKTSTTTLEEAFLSFTGRVIREEGVSTIETMRLRRRMFHR